MKHNDEYQPMDIRLVHSLLKETRVQFDRLIVRERIAINLDMSVYKATPSLFSQVQHPFIVKDYRMVYVLAGSASVEINFVCYEVQAGDVILIPESTYLEILEASPDAQGQIVAFAPDKHHTLPLLGVRHFVKVHLQAQDAEQVSLLLHTLYTFVAAEPYRPDVAEPLVAALFNHIAHLAEDDHAMAAPTHQEQVYARFMELLTANQAGKQPVTYYADRLCITPQYLSKVVTLVSGNTVSHWINKAVVLDARILLKETSKSISEIAEALNFPNDSFFCRFFKRETGLSPTQYRKAKG